MMFLFVRAAVELLHSQGIPAVQLLEHLSGIITLRILRNHDKLQPAYRVPHNKVDYDTHTCDKR
jgi:hypothetical protein